MPMAAAITNASAKRSSLDARPATLGLQLAHDGRICGSSVAASANTGREQLSLKAPATPPKPPL